jgi:hypothetical protein
MRAIGLSSATGSRHAGASAKSKIEDHFFHAMRIRNGKALWRDFYSSRPEALEALGLRE